MQPYNKSWRFTDEKITHADYAFVLPAPRDRVGRRLFLQNTAQQCPPIWHDFGMPAFSFADDEVYGA